MASTDAEIVAVSDMGRKTLIKLDMDVMRIAFDAEDWVRVVQAADVIRHLALAMGTA